GAQVERDGGRGGRQQPAQAGRAAAPAGDDPGPGHRGRRRVSVGLLLRVGAGAIRRAGVGGGLHGGRLPVAPVQVDRRGLAVRVVPGAGEVLVVLAVVLVAVGIAGDGVRGLLRAVGEDVLLALLT